MLFTDYLIVLALLLIIWIAGCFSVYFWSAFFQTLKEIREEKRQKNG